MEASEAAKLIYSKQKDQILSALNYLHHADKGRLRDVVAAAVKEGYVKVGGDVIWKTPVGETDPTAGGNLKTMAWMIRTGWRTTVSIALSDLAKLSDQQLEHLAELLTLDEDGIKKIAFSDSTG
jgi:hypothetical protein